MQKTVPQTVSLTQKLWGNDMSQGIIALFFGILLLFWPLLSLLTLVYIASAYAFGLGILELVYGATIMRERRDWWMNMLIGLITLGVGTYLVRHLAVTFTTFIIILGLTLIIRGIIEAMQGVVGRGEGTHRMMEMLVSSAAVIIGIVILFQVTSMSVAFVWILGFYALLYSALRVAIACSVYRQLPESE